MFKCTHCEAEYGGVYTVDGKLKDGDVCPRCKDGVLRPIKDEQDNPFSVGIEWRVRP